MDSFLKKKLATGACLVAVLFGMLSCSKDEDLATNEENLTNARLALAVDECGCPETPTTTVTLSGTITTNTTLTSNNLYLISGKVFVTNGATLTINPGTRLEGIYNSNPVNASALVITKGSKIIADGDTGGTICPIVFSAHIDSTNPTATVGDWGGLVILGNAEINTTSGTAFIEGISPSSVPAGVDATYGGENNADNSGILSYVRVEYAGASIATDNELNSFTFGGVGAGTQLDHLQSYYGADDSFEFFGGNVNGKYLISTAANDDAFDFDLGYTGNLQFLVAVLDPEAPYSANANGIESDNDATTSGNTPLTRPVISNLTIVGTEDSDGASGNVQYGAHFRRNSRLVLRNSVLYGYDPVVFLDAAVYGSLTNTLTSTANNTSIFAHNVLGRISTSAAWNNSGWTPSATNSLVLYSGITLGSPYGYGNFFASSAPLRPTANPAQTGADFTGLSSSFFTTTTYKGAFPSSGGYWIADCWVNEDFPIF